jgi:hypothetical protein
MQESDEKKPPVGGLQAGAERVIEHAMRPTAVTYEQRVGAALWLMAQGFERNALNADSASVVMYPLTRYTVTGVRKAAVRVLTDALSVALRAAPHQEFDRIETALEQCHQRWAPRPE